MWRRRLGAAAAAASAAAASGLQGAAAQSAAAVVWDEETQPLPAELFNERVSWLMFPEAAFGEPRGEAALELLFATPAVACGSEGRAGGRLALLEARGRMRRACACVPDHARQLGEVLRGQAFMGNQARRCLEGLAHAIGPDMQCAFAARGPVALCLVAVTLALREGLVALAKMEQAKATPIPAGLLRPLLSDRSHFHRVLTDDWSRRLAASVFESLGRISRLLEGNADTAMGGVGSGTLAAVLAAGGEAELASDCMSHPSLAAALDPGAPPRLSSDQCGSEAEVAARCSTLAVAGLRLGSEAKNASDDFAFAAWRRFSSACWREGLHDMLHQRDSPFLPLGNYLRLRSIGVEASSGSSWGSAIRLCRSTASVVLSRSLDDQRFPDAELSVVAASREPREDPWPQSPQTMKLSGFQAVELLLHVHPLIAEAYWAFESPGLGYVFTLPISLQWRFRCVFPIRSARSFGAVTRSRATVLVWQPERGRVRVEEAERREAPSLRVSCPLPPRTVEPLVVDGGRGSDLREPMILELWEAPGHEAPVAVSLELCPAPAINLARPPYLVACTEPLYGLGALEDRWPGFLEAWLDYHLGLGVSKFVVYDTDGSFGPVWRRYWKRASVEYVARFQEQVGEAFAAGEPPPERSELLAYDHCALSHRGLARYVMRLHNVDDWLVRVGDAAAQDGPMNLQRDLEILDAPSNVGFSIARLEFLGPWEAGATSPIQGWRHRLRGPAVGEQTSTGDTLGTVIVDPNSVDYLNTHGAVFRNPLESTVSPLQAWRSFHYYDLFRARSADCTPKPIYSSAWMRNYVDAMCRSTSELSELVRDDRLAMMMARAP